MLLALAHLRRRDRGARGAVEDRRSSSRAALLAGVRGRAVSASASRSPTSPRTRAGPRRHGAQRGARRCWRWSPPSYVLSEAPWTTTATRSPTRSSRAARPWSARDGAQLGTVREVLENEREHIFDGLVIDTPGGERFVDAPEVARIAERARDARARPPRRPRSLPERDHAGGPTYKANPAPGASAASSGAAGDATDPVRLSVALIAGEDETSTSQTAGAVRAHGASGQSTLTVTDNRTGQTYEVQITDGTVRAMDFRQIKVDEDDFGLMTYDPAFTNTASCRSAITYIDGDEGHPRVPRLPDRAARREVHLPRGRLPAHPRRAADARRSSTSGRTRSRSTRSCTRTSRSSCRASATTRTRWGCCSARSARCRRSIPTPTRSTTRTTATSRRSG